MSKLRISSPFASANDTASVLGVSDARTQKLRTLVAKFRNSERSKAGEFVVHKTSPQKGHYAFKKAGRKARKAR